MPVAARRVLFFPLLALVALALSCLRSLLSSLRTRGRMAAPAGPYRNDWGWVSGCSLRRFGCSPVIVWTKRDLQPFRGRQEFGDAACLRYPAPASGKGLTEDTRSGTVMAVPWPLRLHRNGGRNSMCHHETSGPQWP